jgi:salicylate hydroxylase
MAQGGAMAIEDGASLGALLPLGTTRADVPFRLQLYEKCRKERVESVQDFTRRNGRNNDGSEGPRPNGKFSFELFSFLAFDSI